MSAHDEDRVKHLLQQALPPVDATAAPARDLWPDVRRRRRAETSTQSRHGWAWLDWALLAGVAVVTVTFPASIPLLLYYL